jgi:membrane-associated phospholipid phosphatase
VISARNKPLIPQNAKNPSGDSCPKTSGRISLWVIRNRSLAWVIGLAVCLVIVFFSLPDYYRLLLWHGLIFKPLLSVMVLVFSLLAISLLWTTGQRIDAWAFLVLNYRGHRPPWLDVIMLGFTQIGSAIAAMAISLVLYLTSDRLLAYEFMLGTLSLWLVVELLKVIVRRSRPFITFVEARIVGHQVGGRSFPSGHTSQVFFAALLLSQHFHAAPWLVFPLYITALLVGITRMYVGAHYPRDVLAGIILGSAWGLAVGTVDRFVGGG